MFENWQDYPNAKTSRLYHQRPLGRHEYISTLQLCIPIPWRVLGGASTGSIQRSSPSTRLCPTTANRRSISCHNLLVRSWGRHRPGQGRIPSIWPARLQDPWGVMGMLPHCCQRIGPPSDRVTGQGERGRTGGELSILHSNRWQLGSFSGSYGHDLGS